MRKRILAAIALGLVFVSALALVTACGDATPTQTVPLSTQSTVQSTWSTQSTTSAPSTTGSTTTAPTVTVPAPTVSTAPSQSVGEALPRPVSGYAFVYDPGMDWLLFEHGNVDDRVYPASLTKIFTAWVALQYMDPDMVVTVGQEVTLIHPESSRAVIRPGDRLTVGMLVQAMLLPSGNDAAYALAAATGYVLSRNNTIPPQTAIERFMQAVNTHALAQGLTGTHFSVPDGIHRYDHYTTPRDILKMAYLAMENPVIAQYCRQAQAQVTFLDGQERTWTNTNLLLHPESEFYVPECIGLKTGYEYLAGNCLLAVFPCEDTYRFVLILQGTTSEDRFADAKWLFEEYLR